MNIYELINAIKEGKSPNITILDLVPSYTTGAPSPMEGDEGEKEKEDELK